MADWTPPEGYTDPGLIVGLASGLLPNMVTLPLEMNQYVRPGTVALAFSVDGIDWRVLDDGAGQWMPPYKRVDDEWMLVHPPPEYPTQLAADRGTCDYRTGVCRIVLDVAPTKDTTISAVYRTDVEEGETPNLSLDPADKAVLESQAEEAMAEAEANAPLPNADCFWCKRYAGVQFPRHFDHRRQAWGHRTGDDIEADWATCEEVKTACAKCGAFLVFSRRDSGKTECGPCERGEPNIGPVACGECMTDDCGNCFGTMSPPGLPGFMGEGPCRCPKCGGGSKKPIDPAPGGA